MLTINDFASIVKNTPLVSIDLIVENEEGNILLGKRKNHPAKNYFFVPGGRIRKDERFEDAFKRIALTELGMEFTLDSAKFLGVYEHIYPSENYAGLPDVSTHYIVISFRIKFPGKAEHLPKEQHIEYWWAPVNELLENKLVHQNTKNYFNGMASFSE